MNIPIERLGCSDYTNEFTSFGELDKLTLNPSASRTVIYVLPIQGRQYKFDLPCKSENHVKK